MFTPAEVRAASRHFEEHAPPLVEAMQRVGPFTLKPQRPTFRMLVRSIISQQISTSAAKSVRLRLQRLVAPKTISVTSIRQLTINELRAVGLSQQKAGYIRGLADMVAEGQVRITVLHRMQDEEVIEELTQVKGIGCWTAQMCLIFSLGRPDVFPVDDLGVRAAIRNLYELKDMPSRQQALEIGAKWSPHATLASWYCWRSLDSG